MSERCWLGIVGCLMLRLCGRVFRFLGASGVILVFQFDFCGMSVALFCCCSFGDFFVLRKDTTSLSRNWLCAQLSKAFQQSSLLVVNWEDLRNSTVNGAFDTYPLVACLLICVACVMILFHWVGAVFNLFCGCGQCSFASFGSSSCLGLSLLFIALWELLWLVLPVHSYGLCSMFDIFSFVFEATRVI